MWSQWFSVDKKDKDYLTYRYFLSLEVENVYITKCDTAMFVAKFVHDNDEIFDVN